MNFYRHHVFICTNVREDGARCCAQADSQAMRDYMKARVKALNLAGPGKCRVNSAGCMDRCDQGPVMAIYPAGVWYTFVDREDIDEIIEQHLVHGRIVERLKI
jgi:(2Fe-2S) ferredoxin